MYNFGRGYYYSRRWLLRSSAMLGAVALALSASGCGQGSAPRALKLGLLPIVDALPLYVAEKEGYWTQLGVTVELSLFASALERDAALQAGQIDLVLNDLVSAGLLAGASGAGSFPVIRLAYRGSPALPMMTVLAAPNSGITTPAQLKGIEIAVSGNTVIEYATDRLLEMAGLAPADIRKTEVTKIPVRMELLSKGQVKAATLPEPFASLGEAMGARRIVDDGKTGVGTSAITVRSTLVEGNADALRRFLGGYERAVAAIASTPERYRTLFIDKAKLPKEVERTLPVPPFPAYQLPTEQDVEAVVKWMVGRGLLKAPLTYAGVVAKGLAPRTTP